MTLISREKRRMFWRSVVLLWRGVPSSLEKMIKKTLIVTTEILVVLESKGVEAVINFTPTNVDNAVYLATIAALRAFKDRLEKAQGRERKVVAGEIGKYMVAHMDGHQLPAQIYDECFEAVYEGEKSKIA
jgi:hypothetical protein